MGALTQQVNDSTSFVYEDGELIPVEEAEKMEQERIEYARAVRSPSLAEDEGWMLVPEFIREEQAALYNTMVQFVVARVNDYLLLKEEYTLDFVKKNWYKNLRLDMESSSVFKRLLTGKPLLLTPPPKSYDTGWYELVEEGEDVCLDVYVTRPYVYATASFPNNPYAMIDGHEWEIVEDTKEGEPEEYVVRYKLGKDKTLYRLSRMNEEDYERLLHPRLRKAINGKDFSWKLTRLEIDDGAE